MNLKELRAEFRSQADDLAEPVKWTDEDFAGYLNDAVSQAARRADLLFDDETPKVCNITVRADVARYLLHESVYRVDRAYLVTAQRTLDPTDERELDSYGPSWRTREGVPDSFIQQRRKIQLVGIPTAADTLKLAVYRTPLELLSEEDDEPEVDPRYHLQLLDWCLHRAYLKHDADAFDADFAAMHALKFTASFGPLPDADTDRRRNQRRGTPTVRYGGL